MFLVAVVKRDLLDNLAEEVRREPKELWACLEALVDLETLEILDYGDRPVEEEVLAN